MHRKTLVTTIAGALLLVAGPALADPGIDKAQPKNAKQKAMLKVIDHWRETYNSDPDKMILDTYAQDATVTFTGASVAGHDQFLALERAIKKAAPGRAMRIDRVLFIDDRTAVVEATELDSARPEFYSPWCALLSFKDGKIVQDRTYLEPNRWPGIEATTGLAKIGGLGAPDTPPPKY